ncbi:MAG: transketolase family protein [Streptosporangiaceae bacterium]
MTDLATGTTGAGAIGASATGAPAATRTAYRDRLLALMTADPRTVCLDTDTGLFSGADFGAATARYIDLGIAEHTAMGAAAGLAASGWLPFVNTMAAFASARALEAVKINIAYAGLPVRIAATHGGVAAGHLGATHYALEDLAVMRALPNMTVVVPADTAATAAAVEQTADLPGPVYLRLGRKPTPPLPPAVDPPVIGRIQVLRDGADVVFACCGPHPVLAALAAADDLAGSGISAAVLNVHTLAPLDRDTLLAHCRDAALVVTVEEHRLAGGLGGAVAETLADLAPRRMLRLGLADGPAVGAGSQDYILERHGLHPARIADRVRTAID